jgi:hypothetical protein
MASWNGVPIPDSPQIKIPNSIPQNFNWDSYVSDPKGTFNKFKGARETHRLNWKGYRTASAKTKQAILSSPSKKVINAAMKQVRSLRGARKIAENAKKVQDAFFEKMPGGANPKNGRIAGGHLLNIVLQGGLALAVIHNTLIQNGINDAVDRQLLRIGLDGSKILTSLGTLYSRVKNLDTKVDIFNNKITKELDRNAKDYGQLNKQIETIGQQVVTAKKQANDALYETRQGKTIVEIKVAEAKKQANDALYEARQNKVSIEAKINEQRISFDGKIQTISSQFQTINSQIAKFNNSVSDVFQKSVNTTISKLQAELASVKANISTIKPPAPVDTASINANAVAAAKAEVRGLQGVISGLTAQINAAMTLGSTAISGISTLAQGVSSANSTANQALNESRSRAAPNMGALQQQLDEKFAATVAQNAKDLKIRDLQLSDLSKEFDKKNEDFSRRLTLTSDQRYKEFIDENNKSLQIKDLQVSDLSKEFDKKNAEFFAQSTKTSQERYDNFVEQNKASLATIKSEITLVKTDIKTNEADITKIDTKLREQEKVNGLALPKLDQILGILPLIPARAADAIKPSIPTIPEITTATGTAMCNNLKTGCGKNAINDAVSNVTGNANTNAANILGAVNAVGQGADLALLGVINSKLGEQLPGGIGGKLTRFAQWAHLDRALNIMVFAATIHNAAMLSNNLGQTLLSLIGNLLGVVGLKDAEGQAFDIGSVISKGIEGLIKGAVGEENYKTLDATWKRANRIYQAAANLLNSIQSLSASILSALEVVGQWNAKVGNALKRFGVVGEKAYTWMNPNVNFQNKYFTALENATNVISQVDQVASEVLSIKETIGQIADQKKELNDSLKENDAIKQKAELPEAAKLAQKESESKAASAALPLAENDKEADEDN